MPKRYPDLRERFERRAAELQQRTLEVMRQVRGIEEELESISTIGNQQFCRVVLKTSGSSEVLVTLCATERVFRHLRRAAKPRRSFSSILCSSVPEAVDELLDARAHLEKKYGPGKWRPR